MGLAGEVSRSDDTTLVDCPRERGGPIAGWEGRKECVTGEWL